MVKEKLNKGLRISARKTFVTLAKSSRFQIVILTISLLSGFISMEMYQPNMCNLLQNNHRKLFDFVEVILMKNK